MSDVLTGAEFAQELQKQTQFHKALDARRLRANAQLEQAKRTVQDLLTEGRESYGTDKPEELEALISKTEKANHDALVDYTKKLQAANEQLEALEEALSVLDTGLSRQPSNASTL